VLLAKTVKGKGFSFAENVVSFHNGAMTKEQFELAMAEGGVEE
jgi:transketolase